MSNFERSTHTEEVAKPIAHFETSMGNFDVELYADKSPLAVWNFINLAEARQETHKTGPFYNGIIFHRVIAGFMIQAGCPDGMGTGGPGYEFDNENHADLSHDSEGILAMANRGPNTNGSQFYITLGETPHLDGGYSIFGKVIKGIETIKAIGTTPTAPGDRPLEDVVIKSVTIQR